jgi:hypothetical protein
MEGFSICTLNLIFFFGFQILENQIESLCSTNWRDVEQATYLIAGTKYVSKGKYQT